MKSFKLTKEQYAWVGLRMVLGWTLLWAFLDKMFGLGYATSSDRAWINGGSPTSGYLQFAVSGPLSGIYQDMAGNGIVDSLFMLALISVGVAMILGVGTRISGMVGAVLMLLLWSTHIPPENNPVTDDHIVYAILFVAMIFVRPGRWLGLGEWWSKTWLVKRLPILE
jgi:thiosulfate dehydrogenase [quinone] large subunit